MFEAKRLIETNVLLIKMFPDCDNKYGFLVDVVRNLIKVCQPIVVQMSFTNLRQTKFVTNALVKDSESFALIMNNICI